MTTIPIVSTFHLAVLRKQLRNQRIAEFPLAITEKPAMLLLNRHVGDSTEINLLPVLALQATPSVHSVNISTLEVVVPALVRFLEDKGPSTSTLVTLCTRASVDYEQREEKNRNYDIPHERLWLLAGKSCLRNQRIAESLLLPV